MILKKTMNEDSTEFNKCLEYYIVILVSLFFRNALNYP